MVGLNYAEQNVDLVRKYQVFTTRENAGIPYIVILDPGDTCWPVRMAESDGMSPPSHLRM